MAALTPTAKMQFFAADGAPLVGGRLYTYIAGTTTDQATYTDSSGGTPNQNPVILDSRGEANIWLGGATYKFKLADSNDVEIWTVDNISAPTSGVSPALSGNVTIDTNSSSPALKITQTGTGYALRVQDSADPDSTSTVIDNTGKVGIGTISPSESLDVSGGNIAMTSSGGVLYAKITPGASLTDLAADGARALTFTTDSVKRVHIADTGEVGIGKTPSAGVELDVLGDIAASVSVKTDTISELTSATGVTIDGVLLKDSLVAASARPMTAATVQASTSGTAIDFNDIPSWVKFITICFTDVSLSGTDNLLVQLGTGTSGSPAYGTTTYNSTSLVIGVGGNASTTGLLIGVNASTNFFTGTMTLGQITTNKFTSSHTGTITYLGGNLTVGAGKADLTATLTQIRITRTGANTFDGGTVNILYT